LFCPEHCHCLRPANPVTVTLRRADGCTRRSVSQIEFVDADREVTGVAVVAQVKATEVGFPGETATGFKFFCKADHVAYWLRWAGRWC
jgi:uncharacterized protein DUF4365